MKCPKCDEPTLLLQSYTKKDGLTIVRRRACRSCEFTFHTHERPVDGDASKTDALE